MKIFSHRAALFVIIALSCLSSPEATASSRERDFAGDFKKELYSHRDNTPRTNARFDAEAWFARREEMVRDSERLQEAYKDCLEKIKTPAEEVTIPVESYEDGSVKASVFAIRAEFFQEEGLVWAEDIVISYFSETGEEIARLDAKSCLVDKNTRSIWAEGFTRVVHGGTTISGDGIYFSLAEEYIIISSNSEISSTDLKLGGIRL
ncbi:MAG: hypothetical protein IJQ34_00135 [Kiritimatiellae bacterium]|nr:hypothetical protein [Kiritimatiellia bacterium]